MKKLKGYINAQLETVLNAIGCAPQGADEDLSYLHTKKEVYKDILNKIEELENGRK